MHADGAGLYLQVTGTGAKSWIFRFTLAGRTRDMGLGSLALVPLTEARLKAFECRRLLQAGADPIEAQVRKPAPADQTMRFEEAAKGYIAAYSASWRNAKHGDQWRNTLATYAYPTFGAQPVAQIDSLMVVRALEPIWLAKPETASRVRGRIQAVLDWATAKGYRTGDNPARWEGHLENLLPRKSKVARVRHHPALPYGQIGDFMMLLDDTKGVAALAL